MAGGVTFSFADVLIDAAANELAADFVRDRIRERIDDEAVAATLTPAGALSIRDESGCVWTVGTSRRSTVPMSRSSMSDRHRSSR